MESVEEVERLLKKVVGSLNEGRQVAALSASRKALDIAQKHRAEAPEVRAECHLVLGSVLHRLGDYSESEENIKSALTLYRDALGATSEPYATTATALALLYEDQSKYGKAMALHSEVAAVRKKSLGETHPLFGVTVNNIGRVLHHTGIYDRAEQMFNIAVGILSKNDAESAGYYFLVVIDNLIDLYHDTGKYAKAIEYCQRNLEAREKSLGSEHIETARSVLRLAKIKRTVGELSEAEILFEKALPICRSVLGEKDLQTISVASSLGCTKFELGKVDEAEELLSGACKATRGTVGYQTLEYAKILNNLAILRDRSGALTEARSLMEEALEALSNAVGEEHAEYARVMDNLGLLYQRLGDPGRGESFIREGLEIRKRALGPGHFEVAVSQGNLAHILGQKHDFPQALKFAERSVATLEGCEGDFDPKHLKILDNLGSVYFQIDQPGRALELFQRCVEGNRAILGDAHPDTLTSLNNLAIVYSYAGRQEEAVRIFEHLAACRSQILASTDPALSMTFNNLAVVKTRMGRASEAEGLYRQSIESFRSAKGMYQRDYPSVLFNLALLLASSGRDTEAMGLMQEGLRVQYSHLYLISKGSSARQLTLFATQAQTYLHSILSLALKRQVHDDSFREMGVRVALGKKGLALELLRRKRRGLPTSVDGIASKLSAVQEKISNLVIQGGSYGDQDSALEALVSEKEAIESSISISDSDEDELFQEPGELDLPKLLEAVPDDSVFVDYSLVPILDFEGSARTTKWSEPRYVATVLGYAECGPMIMDLGPAKLIDDLIIRFRSFLLAGRTLEDREFGSLASSLREALLGPMIPLPKSVRQLILSPDAGLNLVPFSALIQLEREDSGSTFSVRYVASINNLSACNEPPATPRKPFLVIGAPDFDNVDVGTTDSPGRGERLLRSLKSAHFAPLPGTSIEASLVASELGCAPVTGAEATASRVRKSRVRILHLATHGFFFGEGSVEDINADESLLKLGGLRRDPLLVEKENPFLKSGLALAGANRFSDPGQLTSAHDSFVTAEDVLSMRLEDTELVVLSACETGLGQTLPGQGVFGLRSAFLIAGCRKLVMSLWKVPDLSTALLMALFYYRLVQRHDEPALALHVAQRELRDLTIEDLGSRWDFDALPPKVMRDKGELREQIDILLSRPPRHRPFRAPFYWAPFVCQG